MTLRLILRFIGYPSKNAPDRHRVQELECLEIPATLGRPVPFCFGILPIRVSICQGGYVSLGTSNYRIPEGKRARSTAGTGDRMSGNTSYGFPPPHSGRFLGFPDPCNRITGRSVSPDTPNYRTPKGKRARSTAETGTRLSGNISYVWSPRPISFGIFLIGVSISQGGTSTPYAPNKLGAKGKRGRSTAETGN